MGIARKKKKKTLKAKMLGILTMCAMTSLLAAVIVSYMELRMIQNDSIEDNMKMYLDQITTKNEILNSTTTFGGGIYSRTVKVYSFI